MKKVIGLMFLLVFCAVAVNGKRVSTTRKKLRPDVEAGVVNRDIEAAADTAVSLSGFDKPLTSRNETFFVTNNLGRGLKRIFVTINYIDNSGRQLHKTSKWIDAEVPAGETRQVSLRSWDTQMSFYYKLSKRPRSQATPFDITASVDSVHYAK